MQSPGTTQQQLTEAFEQYRVRIDTALSEILSQLGEPSSLYDPIKYAMSADGKRMRPLLTLISASVFGSNKEAALYVAIAIEILHNFTLVHDDIMDKSFLRRGNPTVHKKWDESTAILSGDVMMGLGYRLLTKHTPPALLPQVLHHFTEGFIEVCEGQAMDIAFSTDQDVSMTDYLTMIEKKTARLPEISAVIGAILGGAAEQEIDVIRQFARNAGIAFQVQDDLLDLMAVEAELGKTIGQDIVEGKKTFLIVQAQKKIKTSEDAELMQRFVHNKGLLREEVGRMRELMLRCGVIDDAEQCIEDYFATALSSLSIITPCEAKDQLVYFVQTLRGRKK